MVNEVRSIRPDHKVSQWRKFLSSSQNKQELIEFIVSEWCKERCRQRLKEKILYATTGEDCYKISSQGSGLNENLR